MGKYAFKLFPVLLMVALFGFALVFVLKTPVTAQENVPMQATPATTAPAPVTGTAAAPTAEGTQEPLPPAIVPVEPTATPLIRVTPGPTLRPDEIPDTGVWVTTQDRSSLRAGPGLLFERTGIVPPETTIPAVGRTADSQWVQVIYENRTGWIAAWLLVWSGDFANLQIDGVNPEPYARRYNTLGITTRETPIYDGQVTPSRLVGSIPAGTQVELTGRLGTVGFIQLQIEYNDQLYWVGSWNLRMQAGSYDRLFDMSYVYAYGRLVALLQRDIGDSTSRLDQIEGVWRGLSSGQSVSCAGIPELIDRRRVADSDVRREPIFEPLVVALDEAISRTNTAITTFSDACGRAAAGGEFFLTEDDVQAALDDVEAARRAFVLASSLLSSLSLRDPFINPQAQQE
jgi:uncharacterized protein YraI